MAADQSTTPHKRDAAVQDPPSQPPPAPDAESRRIAEVSPEGIPATSTNKRAVGGFVLGFAIIALVASVLLAVFVNRWAGLSVGVLAIGLLLFNPALWSAVLRAQEQDR